MNLPIIIHKTARAVAVGCSDLLGRIFMFQCEYANRLLTSIVNVRKILSYIIAVSHRKPRCNLNVCNHLKILLTHHLGQPHYIRGINKNRKLMPARIYRLNNVGVHVSKERPKSDSKRRMQKRIQSLTKNLTGGGGDDANGRDSDTAPNQPKFPFGQQLWTIPCTHLSCS